MAEARQAKATLLGESHDPDPQASGVDVCLAFDPANRAAARQTSRESVQGAQLSMILRNGQSGIERRAPLLITVDWSLSPRAAACH